MSPFHLLAGVDALVATLALDRGAQGGRGTCAQQRPRRRHHGRDRRDRDLTSTSCWLCRTDASHDSLRRAHAVTAYLAAVGVGIVLIVKHQPFTIVDGAISWAIAGVLAIAPMRARYIGSIGYHRERLEWFGIGVVPGGHGGARGDRAAPPGRLARSAGRGRRRCDGARPPRVSWPGRARRWGPTASRGLVQVLAVFGFVVVVSAIYLVVVLGLGHAPKTTGRQGGARPCPWWPRAWPPLIFVPVRERFVESATRFVYGSREAPDEVLRTFGSRLTRAIPMDELLLQLAESLRKTMGLTSAEVYTGTGEVLDRTVSVPDLGPWSIVVTPRERPVVTRAGVSGTAWASVWLPALARRSREGADPGGPGQPRR